MVDEIKTLTMKLHVDLETYEKSDCCFLRVLMMPSVICKKMSFFDHRLLFDKCAEGIKERNGSERVGGGNKGKRRQRGREEAGRREEEEKEGRKAEKHLRTIINSVPKLFLSLGTQQ